MFRSAVRSSVFGELSLNQTDFTVTLATLGDAAENVVFAAKNLRLRSISIIGLVHPIRRAFYGRHFDGHNGAWKQQIYVRT